MTSSVDPPTRDTLLETGLANAAARCGGPRSYVIEVLEGRAARDRIALGARPILVGADAACDLVLDDPRVSRKHAEIAVEREGLKLRDLASTNGSWIDGVRVNEAVFLPGATLKL